MRIWHTIQVGSSPVKLPSPLLDQPFCINRPGHDLVQRCQPAQIPQQEGSVDVYQTSTVLRCPFHFIFNAFRTIPKHTWDYYAYTKKAVVPSERLTFIFHHLFPEVNF